MPAPNASSAALGATQIAEVNGVAGPIRTASRVTGVSFDYLMAQANSESSFVADAKSPLSSASGLFQFTRGTWLELIKLHGAAYGLEAEAAAIEAGPRGSFRVADPVMRQKILGLRRDPTLSSLIAGEYARDNRHLLEKSLGHRVGATEVYLAHFLGPSGAVKMLQAKADDPNRAAADIVPQAAATNPAMFFDSDRTPQSVAALYDRVHQVMAAPLHAVRQRHSPEAALAAAARRFGSLPWTAAVPDGLPDSAALAATVRISIQAYTDSARSADRISAPMPPSAAALPAAAPGAVADWFKRLLG